MKKTVLMPSKVWILCILVSLLITVLFGRTFYHSLQDYYGTKITLTALSDEVRLQYVQVDGRIIPITESEQGNWIRYKGNPDYLGWANYGNEGSFTAQITIKVPAGTQRNLMFQTNVWRGDVEIEDNGAVQTVDTFYNSQTNRLLSVPISETNTNMMIFPTIITSILFFLFLTCILLITVRFMVKKKSKIIYWWKTHKFFVVLLGIAVLSTVVSIFFSNGRSFWNDDIAQIHFTSKNIPVAEMYQRFLAGDVQPPLFSFFTAIWLRIMPYGTGWLRTLGELFTFVSIITCGYIGKALKSSRTGIISACILATSFFVLKECTYSWRPYSLFFCAVSLLILIYIYRNLNNLKLIRWKQTVLLGFGLTVVAYSQYFGLFACFALFLVDFYLVLRKKASYKIFFSYLIAFVCYLPWLIVLFTVSIHTFSTFWPEIPTLSIFFNSYVTLLDNRLFFIWVLILAGIILLYSWVKKTNKFQLKPTKYFNYNILALLLMATLPILIAYVYSVYINPTRSVFVIRYFVGALPALILFIALGIDWILESLVDKKGNTLVSYFLIAATFCFLFTSYTQQVKIYSDTIYQPYEEAAELIYHQNDVRDENTAVVITSLYMDGWDYYLSHNGNRDGIPFMSANDFNLFELENKEKIYLFEVHSTLDQYPVFAEILNSEYTMIREYPDEHVTVYVRNNLI